MVCCWQPFLHPVSSVNVMHSLLTIARSCSLICFILIFFSPSVTPSKCPQQNHPNSCLWPSCLSSHFDKKISCSCYISSFCLLPPPSSLEKMGCMKGKQVLGRAMTLVDKYTRLLTNLYSCVSIIETQVYYLEKVLVSLTCMMVYDIWCFCTMQVRTILRSAWPTQPSSLKRNIYVQNLRCKHKITDDDHNIISKALTL